MARVVYSALGEDEEVEVRCVDTPSPGVGAENELPAGVVSGLRQSQSARWNVEPQAQMALPLEMLFQDRHEETHNTHHRQERRLLSGEEAQAQHRIPLATDSLLGGDSTFGTRDYSAGYTSTRALSGSSRSYEPSERGDERPDYTFSANTSPLYSASFPTKSGSRLATSDEAIATARRLRSQTSLLDREYDHDSTIRGRNNSYTYPSATEPIRRASTKGVAVQSPFPNLKIPGRHPSSVLDLEEAAERLSMADSIEDSIRKEYEDIKHNDSRKSSMRRSSLMNIITDVPYGATEGKQAGEAAMFQSPTSFVDPARSTGYSPAGAVLTKGRNRADSKCSKTSAYGTRPEPPLEGMPLAQFTGVTSVSRQNSQYSIMSSRNISRAQSIAGLEVDMNAVRRPLAVRNPSKDELDGDLGQQPLDRPITSDSHADYEQTQTLFEDFDGQHISEAPHVEVEEDAQSEVRHELGKRKSTATLLGQPNENRFERPKSYADPLTGQQMVFYPAPVPSMLQLPPKLSNRPNANARAKRHTEVLISAPGARPAHSRNQSSVWLPDAEGDDEDKRKPFMDVDLSGPPGSFATTPARSKDARRNTSLPMPEHLRANEYFEQIPASQIVEIKEQSAVKTLDDILDASAHAPVSAFTDHAFAGHLGSEIYGNDSRKTRTKSQLFGSSSGLVDREGKENRKPILGKRASSFFGLVNKSEDALGGDRKSTLGILGRGKSPAYDVVGNASPTRQRDDAGDQQSEDGDEGREEQREMDGRYAEDVYTGAPTTLLAELQLRKQQAKQRTQPSFLPNGFRTTLLEMDAVAQVEEKTRKTKRVTLAWQDQSVVQQERDQESEDEEMPLGMLFPEQARRQQDNAVRPMGLMERRELEDNEPLSKRRDRLRGKQPLMRPPVVNRASTSTMMLFQTNNNEGDTIMPAAEVEQVNRLSGDDAGARALSNARPVSGEFSLELITRYGAGGGGGTPEPTLEAAAGAGGGGGAAVAEEDETLSQRRKRLIAEKEAREKEVRSGTPDFEGSGRPVIKQRRSMADVLQAHPARARTPEFGIGMHSRQSSTADVRVLGLGRPKERVAGDGAGAGPGAMGHNRTHSSEFPHLAAAERERERSQMQKAQIAQMQAEVQAQQQAQHVAMRGMGLLGSTYGGSMAAYGGSGSGMDYRAQVLINNGLGLGSASQAGMQGVMVASPLASVGSGYFGNKEMVDRMIAMRLGAASQAAVSRPGQMAHAQGGFEMGGGMGTGLGVGLNGSFGLPSSSMQGMGRTGMGTLGAGKGMGPQNQGEWRNQQVQWAHWARMQGLGMGLGMQGGAGGMGGGVGGIGGGGNGNGGVDMVEKWRRGVGGLGSG